MVAESLLIRATLGRLGRVTLQEPISLRQAFQVSLVGNLVWISCSILLPVAIPWLLSWPAADLAKSPCCGPPTARGSLPG